jgi:hypothetical protein
MKPFLQRIRIKENPKPNLYAPLLNATPAGDPQRIHYLAPPVRTANLPSGWAATSLAGHDPRASTFFSKTPFIPNA